MTQAELDKILNTYKWIPFPEVETTNIEILKVHHIQETEFLIAKVRELAQELYDREQDILGIERQAQYAEEMGREP